MSPWIRNSLRKKKKQSFLWPLWFAVKNKSERKTRRKNNYMLPQTFFVILLSASIYVKKGKYQTK